MKALITIEFNLPEEDYNLRCVSNGIKLAGILLSLDTRIRDIIKYSNVSDETCSKLTEIRQMLLDGLSDIGL